MEAIQTKKNDVFFLKPVLWGLWGISLCYVLYQLFSYQVATGGRSDSSEVASIVEKSGDVSYRKSSDFDWLSARAISNLFENELFSTGEESKAKLALGKNLYLDLDANTVIKLDPPKGLGGDTEIYLVSGDLKVDVEGGEQQIAPKVVIKSGTSTFEVKGSGSSLRLKKEKGTEGVAVTQTAGNVQSVVGDRKVAVTRPREIKEHVTSLDTSRVLNIPVELALSEKIVAKKAIEEVPAPSPVTIEAAEEESSKPVATAALVPKVETPVEKPVAAQPEVPKPVPVADVPKPAPIIAPKQVVKPKPSEEKIVVKPSAVYRVRIFKAAKNLPSVKLLIKNPKIQVEPTSAPEPKGSGIFATDGKVILAEIMGPASRSKELDDIRKAVDGKVIFKGEATQFLKPDEVAKFNTLDKKNLFLQSGKRVLPVSEDLANSFQDFGAMISAQKTLVFRGKVEILSP